MLSAAPAFRPKSGMQEPSGAEYSQKCTPHPTPGLRGKKANRLGPQLPQEVPRATSQIFPQDGRTPPREAHGGVLTCPKTIWEVSPGASDGGWFQPRLFVAEADAQRLGLAYQVALGVDKLELAGDLLERHVAHLAVAQGDHVAKLAA